MNKLKIIQIQAMLNDEYWQGVILGLGNDGVTYQYDGSGWSVYAPAIDMSHSESQGDEEHERIDVFQEMNINEIPTVLNGMLSALTTTKHKGQQR